MQNFINVKNYESLYEISKNGDVKSKKSDKILGVKITNFRVYVRLYKDGVCTNRNVDELVLEHFQPNYKGQHIIHKDNDPYNCNIDNLYFKGKYDKQSYNEAKNLKYIIYYESVDGYRCINSENSSIFTTNKINYDLYPRHFHMFKGYDASDEGLMLFFNDFKEWTKELKKYDIDYLKNYSHLLAVQNEFKKRANKIYEKFSKITYKEYELFKKCFNGGHSYLSKPGVYDSFGYDFSANYPTILSSEDFKIPTTEYKEYILNELPKRKKIELGIYHVKITSDNKEFLKVFSFSKHHYYTDTSLKFALKHKKQFNVNIELIQDDEPNAFIYHDYVTGDKIFGEWFKDLIKIKNECKGNKLIKHLLTSVWGTIAHPENLNKTYQEIINENIKIDEDYFINDRKFVGQGDDELEYYELISLNNIYKYNIRLMPFLSSYARKKLADVILIDDNIDYLIRTQTDNAVFSKKINFDDIKDFLPEEKTTGKINWGRKSYFKV